MKLLLAILLAVSAQIKLVPPNSPFPGHVTVSVGSLGVVTSTSNLSEITVEKSDITKVDYQDKDGANRVKYVYSALVRVSKDFPDVVRTIEVRVCRKSHSPEDTTDLESPDAGSLLSLKTMHCETGWLTGRFLPDKASWSNPLTVPEGTESVRIIRVQTSEAQ